VSKLTMPYRISNLFMVHPDRKETSTSSIRSPGNGRY
jgi:hypothetical protein